MLSLEESRQKYSLYLRTEKQASPQTHDSYLRDITKLQNYYGKDIDVSQITPGDIRQCMATLHRESISPRSLQRWLSAIRSLFNFCIQKQFLKNNPCDAIQPPKNKKSLPKTLDVDEVNRLLTNKASSFLARRDHAIAELFYSSGLRLSELVALNCKDLDLTAGSVVVTGKGNKVRLLPVGKIAREALQEWLLCRKPHAHEGQLALFISQHGTRIGQRNIQQRLKKLAIERQLSQPLNPHMLRHSFASHMLESSGDLRAVQELLGHANISTTQIYTHLDFQHLAKVYDQAHPRAKKSKDR